MCKNHSLSISVAAMGSPKGGSEEGGSVKAFQYNDGSDGSTAGWSPHGSMIQSPPPLAEAAGYSISLSDSGSAMIIGFPKASNPNNGAGYTGKAAVYMKDETTPEWQLLGDEMYGEGQGSLDGTSIAMSHDGSIVVIGGKGWSEVNETTGEVILQAAGICRIHEFINGQWELVHIIKGKADEERLGSSAAISPEGNVVACGGVDGSLDGTSKSGVVRLWNRVTLQDSTVWPRGVSDDDVVEGATFGTSVALSDEGGHVIVGAPTWNDAGAIQMFRDAL